MHYRRSRDYGAFRHGLYASVGAGLILYETTLDLLRDLLDAGRVAPEEGRRIIDEFARRSEYEYNYEQYETEKHHRHAEFATKDDVKTLKAELEKINQKLSEQAARQHAPEV